MYSPTISSVFLLVSTFLTLASPSLASASNFTLRATSTSVRATCTKVSGTAYGHAFNFGCLCLDDLDDFCGNNGINSYFKGLLSDYISSKGQTYSYPSNAQPICDGTGGYNCGSLTKLSNGQCGNSNTNYCDPNQCFSNGGCCPRGQTYSNGKCCASTGCSRSGQVCTPVLTCSTYTSNNICCPSGTSGWTGQKTRCCPSGQIESSDGTDCICPAGQKEDPKDANKCVAACSTGMTWGATKCCPSVATEKNGVCQCPTGKKLSTDGTKCEDSCDTGNGWKWCNKRCCPNGSDEESTGKCVCSDPQTILNSAGTACVDRCPNGNWGGSMCCNGASTETGGKCVCNAASQTYTGTGDAGKCGDKCTNGSVWAPKQQICCPAGSTENDKGVCMCTDDSKKIDNGACVNKCKTGETYNLNTKTCCAAGTTSTSTGCGCSSASQVYQNGNCVNRCANDWVYAPGVSGQCCPPGSKANTAGNACVCNDVSKKITGTGTSASCTDKCTTSGWTYAPKQDSCCPPNSAEVSGVCACKDNTQQIEGTGSNAKCADRCKISGWTWGGMNKQCCPPGSTEDCDGKCTCTNTAQQITGTGSSQMCTDRCPSGTKWWTSKCCPIGSTQKGDICDCDDNSQKLSDDGKTCVDLCPSGQFFGGSRCCPNDSWQWGDYNCLCKLWLYGYRLSPDQSQCQPQCRAGYTFRSSQCCKDYLIEKNGQCQCPNSGDSDSGASCQPSCPTGQKYNPATKSCETICADGFTYKKGWKGDGFCCKTSETACNTRCCPAPYVEIGNTGICCNSGAQVVNGKCVESTYTPKRRGLIQENGQKIQLTPSTSAGKSAAAASAYFGMESNKEGKLCPVGLAACPIPGRTDGEYECLDSQSDLQSCGGCASMGTGEDCTAIQGAKWMGCNVGKCEVYSCKAGWKVFKGRCVKK